MSRIKECFVSRYENGCLIEADYSQLEVIVLACITGDEQLKEDLRAGLDMHRVRAADLFNIEQGLVTDKQRRQAKALSFQLQYGAGAPSMAASTGLPVSVCEKFIRQYYERYPKVKDWQDDMIANAAAYRHQSKFIDQGHPVGIFNFNSMSGRRITFREKIRINQFSYAKTTKCKVPLSYAKTTKCKVPPQNLKNYPVQSLATADIVPMMIAELHNAIHEFEVFQRCGVKLINTVHDSILFDIEDESHVVEIGKAIKSIMEQVPQVFKKKFNIELDMDFPVEVEYGTNWLNMTPLEV